MENYIYPKLNNFLGKKLKPKELFEIIAGGESSTVEFKRKTTKYEKIAKEIVAMANTKGGYLIIGVDDDGTIYGIESEKSETEIIQQTCLFYIEPPIEPNIQIVNLNKKDILVLKIESSNKKPHKVINDEKNVKEYPKAYIRVGEKSIEASREMTRFLKSLTDERPLKIGIGENEKRLFEFIERNGRATVKDFAKIVNISTRRAERIMITLVRAGVLQIHNDSSSDYFTLV